MSTSQPEIQDDQSTTDTEGFLDYILNSTNLVTGSIKSHHVVIFFLLIICLLLFHFRHKIIARIERYRTERRFNGGFYTNLESFQDDIANGLTSNNFDLEANNLSTGDTRSGLSIDAKLEIKKIMEQKGIGFDQARLEFTRKQLNQNNIDEQGVPKDPKLVTF